MPVLSHCESHMSISRDVNRPTLQSCVLARSLHIIHAHVHGLSLSCNTSPGLDFGVGVFDALDYSDFHRNPMQIYFPVSFIRLLIAKYVVRGHGPQSRHAGMVRFESVSRAFGARDVQGDSQQAIRTRLEHTHTPKWFNRSS